MKKNNFTSIKSLNDVDIAKKNYKKIYKKIETLHFKKLNINCPFCNSKNRKVFFNYLNSKYFDCLDCNSIYFFPKIEKKGLKEFYKLSNSLNMVNSIPKKFDTIRRKKLMEPRVKIFREKIMEYNVNIPVKNLLEIGSGIGYFAEICKKYNLSKKITVIEPDKFGYSITKKNNPDFHCINSIFEDTKLNKKYDLIFINSVIEHPYDIGYFFKKLKTILNKNGFICLTDMNSTGIDIRTLKEKTPNVNPYSILQIASTLGLGKLLNKNNLKIKECYSAGSLDSDIIYSVLKDKKISIENKPMMELLKNKVNRSNFQKYLISNNLTGYTSYIISHK